MSKEYYDTIKAWRLVAKEEHRNTRETCGLLIASSFSMIILLLSFVVRNNILNFGIFALTISIIALLELVASSKVRFPDIKTKDINDEDIKDFMDWMYNQLLKLNTKASIGIFYFYVGLLLIFIFFNLEIIGFLIFTYMIYRFISFFNENLKERKNVKQNGDYFMGKHEITNISLSYYKKYLIRLTLLIISIIFIIFIPLYMTYQKN